MNIKKSGLSFFPFDIDFFQDDKIQFVSARFGLKGECIAIRLLVKIYRQGYYTEWDEDTALLFAKSVGDGVQHSFVNDVVYELLKRGFFDKSIFERFGVLTSRGIQKRFFDAAKRRNSIDVFKHLLLAPIEEYENVNILIDNVNILAENADILEQRIEENRIEENRKEENISERAKMMILGEFGHVHMKSIEYQKLIDKYGEYMVESKIASLDENIQSKVKKYMEYKDHYATINGWCRKDVESKDKSTNSKPDYSDPSRYENLTAEV